MMEVMEVFIIGVPTGGSSKEVQCEYLCGKAEAYNWLHARA